MYIQEWGPELRTSVTWHNIPEDSILHSHRRENLGSYRSTLVINHVRYKVYTTRMDKYDKSHYISTRDINQY
jgi:hypothetical protein